MSRTRRTAGISGRLVGLMTLAGAAILLAGCLAETRAPVRPAFYVDLAAPGAQLDPNTTSEIVNAYRGRSGLPPLVWDEGLAAIAAREAERLAAIGEVREGAEGQLDQALAGAGFRAKEVMRSITGGYHSFADAFSGWRGARHHDAVLRMPDGTRYGLAAIARPASRHRVYWVLLVAKG